MGLLRPFGARNDNYGIDYSTRAFLMLLKSSFTSFQKRLRKVNCIDPSLFQRERITGRASFLSLFEAQLVEHL